MIDRCEPPPELRGVDGWHAFKMSTGDATGIDCWYWVTREHYPDIPNECSGSWTKEPLRENAEFVWDFSDYGVTVHEYLCPVATPAEVEALRAERDTLRARVARLEQALDQIASGDHPEGTSLAANNNYRELCARLQSIAFIALSAETP